MAKKRPDGRLHNAVRPVGVVQGLLSRADGSVRYMQGRTCVIAAVFGPMQVSGRQEKMDKAAVEVVFKTPTGSRTNEDVERAFIVRQALEAVVLANLHPRTRIAVVLQVVHDDGALLAVAINAGCLALVNAGVQCKAMVTAVTIAVEKADSDDADPSTASASTSASASASAAPASAASSTPTVPAVMEDTLLLDPSAADEARHRCRVTLAFSSTTGELVVADSRGRWQPAAYLKAVLAGQRASEKLQAYLTLALKKRAIKG